MMFWLNIALHKIWLNISKEIKRPDFLSNLALLNRGSSKFPIRRVQYLGCTTAVCRSHPQNAGPDVTVLRACLLGGRNISLGIVPCFLRLYRIHARTGPQPACMECKQKDLDMSEHVLSPLVSNQDRLVKCLLGWMGSLVCPTLASEKKSACVYSCKHWVVCKFSVDLKHTVCRDYFWNCGLKIEN